MQMQIRLWLRLLLDKRQRQNVMRLLISGANGLIGRSLKKMLEGSGHEVVPLVRKRSPGSVFWDPERADANPADFEGFDGVIHLAGENIASKRWSQEQKDQIFRSRCRGTWILSQLLSKVSKPPKVLICASAVGYYGNRGDEILTENSPAGTGFLAEVCVKWEASTEILKQRGVRVVHTRFGTVLSAEGGMLAKMVPIYRFGLGGKLGSGEQFVSWIALSDLVGALVCILHNEGISGGVNVTSPFPVPQAEFAHTLAYVLGRKTHLNLPAWFLRIALGEIADEVILSSTRATPAKLLASGFSFHYPQLEPALRVITRGG
jgi:uncharacterized protein (TIGR01777 family)